MLVDPAETDAPDVLELVFDLRDLYTISPLPAAAPRGDEDEDGEEDEEDDADDSDDSSGDGDESDDEEDDEDDKAATAKLIKDLREENKARRLKLRAITKERDRLKADNARLKKSSASSTRRKAEEPDEEEDEDPDKLTPREEAAEIKSALVDVMSDLDINKKYRRLIGALVDPEDIDIEVSDTGKVKVSGLKEAIEELLEDYPEWQDKGEESGEGSGRTRSTSSGNRRRQGSSNGLDKASLAKKYPALAQR